MGLNNNLGRLTEVLTVSGSNVGIGKTVPTAKLDISGSTLITGSLQVSGSTTATSFIKPGGSIFEFLKANGDVDTNMYHKGSVTSGYLPRSLYPSSGDYTTSLIYDNGTNVGIGTTTPSAKLTISDTNTVTNQIDLVGYGSTAKGHIGEFAGNLYISSNYFYNGTQNADTSSLGQSAIVLSAGTTTTSFIDFNLSDAGTTSPANKVRILSNGNVGIGTATPLSGLVVQKNTSGGRGGEISIVNYATLATGNAAALNFGLESSTYNNDDCNFQVKAVTTGLSGASTDGVFSNWNGANFVETLRIKSTGTLSVPYGQIQFPSSQNASSDPNTLDDYEEGTWSPVLAGTSGGYANMTGITSGRYTKIGNKVTATAQIQWGSIAVSISGNRVVQGLPFASVTGGVRCCGSMGAVSSGITFPAGYGEWVYLIDPGFSSVYIIANSTTGAGYTHLPNVGSSGIVYSLTITYFTA